jgi:hypothetical protein
MQQCHCPDCGIGGADKIIVGDFLLSAENVVPHLPGAEGQEGALIQQDTIGAGQDFEPEIAFEPSSKAAEQSAGRGFGS